MLMVPSHEDQREGKKKGEREKEREREMDKDALYIRGTFVWP